MSDALNPEAAPTKRSRPVHTYKLPKRLANGIQTIGMVLLTPDEEIQANKRARGDNAKLAFELMKQSIAEINEKPVSLADGSIDEAWQKMESPVRQLIASAYSELNKVEEEDEESFLKSRVTKVG